MKIKLLIITLLYSILSYSQARLNYSIKQIQTEFKSYPQKVSKGVLNVYDKEVIISYYFKDNKCKKVIINTKSIIIANFLINEYTKNYEKVGNTEWIMYSNTYGYANIYLDYSNNSYNFIWK